MSGEAPQPKEGMTALRLLDRMVAVVSWLTLVALVVLSVMRHCFGWAPSWPSWIQVWLVPVLTAAAVGYLTNYLAIWLLFRPYTKHGPFWGVIPRNQPRLAASVGKVIPERLLPPAELAQTITDLAGTFLRDPETLTRVRRAVGAAVAANGQAIAAFLVPYASRSLRVVLDDQLKAEKVARLVGFCAEQYLAKPENRAKVAEGILLELQKNVPQLTSFLCSSLRPAAISYLDQRFGMMLAMVGGADTVVDGILNHLDWASIEQLISERLSTAETQKVLADEVGNLATRLQEHLQTPEAQQALDQFIAEHTPQLENAIAGYLQEKLPGMLEALFGNDGLWNAIAEKLLPYLQQLIEQELTTNSEKIIARLDLQGRIERAVNDLDPAEAHRLINQVSGRELTLLQVLGYFLGAIAGFLMIFAG